MMGVKTKTLLVRLAFGAYLAAVLYLCFANLERAPHVPRSFWGIPTDKLVHFAMFLPFYPLAYYSLGKRAWMGFALGLAVSASTELGQSWLTSYRTGDFSDWRIDLLALAIGLAAVSLVEVFTKKRQG